VPLAVCFAEHCIGYRRCFRAGKSLAQALTYGWAAQEQWIIKLPGCRLLPPPSATGYESGA